MKKEDKMMLGGTLVLAIIVMETIIFGGLGLGVVIGVMAYFGCLGLFSKFYEKKMSKVARWLLIPIILCTLCFILFSNTILRGFNLMFLAVLLLIHALEVFKKCEHVTFAPTWVGEVLKFGVTLPFTHINKPVVLVRDELGTGQKKNIKVVGKVLMGLVAAVPMLIIIVGLLASADAAFEGTINFVFTHIAFNADQLVGKFFIIVILFFMFFSYFYGLAHNHFVEDRDARVQGKAAPVNHTFKLDFVVTSTIATMLCLVYLIFCFSQLAYFLSAFNGILPIDFTAAEYARRGFFETLPLTGFNLLVIILLSWVVEVEIGKKSIYAKGMVSFITAFTLFMVMCALSKMFMYMQKYGLSLWRVYVAWFLVLSLLIVLVVFTKVFWQKMQVIKVVFIIFTVMYIGLNYSNVDYFIASQNVSLYEQNKMSDLSGCYNLSTSAMGPIQKLVLAHPEVLQDDGEENAYKATGIIDRLERNLKNKKWQEWNIADYRANQALKEIK